MKKQPERTAKTRQSLIDAFWSLYTQRPIEKITIKEITDTAGVYRSTFYQYFTDVYAVRDEVEKDVISSYVDILSHIPEITSLDDGMKLIFSFYSQNAEYLTVLLGTHGDPAFLSDIKGQIKSVMQNVLDIPEGDIEADLFIELAFASIIALLNYWHENRETVMLQTLLETGSQFFRNGLIPFLTKKGLDLNFI